MVVRGVEIEHCRELTRDITTIMELLFILNGAEGAEGVCTSGWESRGRKEVLDKEEIEQELELLHCLEGEQKCCRCLVKVDKRSMIYVNNRHDTRWE